MSAQIVLKATSRTQVGATGPRKVRKSGSIPAIVYGAGFNLPISINEIESRGALSHHGVITLVIDGKKQEVIIKEVQRSVIARAVSHVDFQAVDATHKVTSIIPVESFGTPAAVSSGGQLEQSIHELEVKCLPANLPEVIKVDVSGMALGAVLTVADLVLPAGVEAVTHGDIALFAVHAPKAAAATTTTEA